MLRDGLPASYLPASWRCVLPPDRATREIGVGFEVADGVVRLALHPSAARALVEEISRVLATEAGPAEPAANPQGLR